MKEPKKDFSKIPESGKQYFLNQDGEKVVALREPFATSGGEGAIFDVIEEEDISIDLIAKIYHTKKIADSRQLKVEYMYAHNPTLGIEKNIKDSIIWVEELLYTNGQFLGFTMRKVMNAIPLKMLTLARNPSKKYGLAWQKFDHDQKGAHQKRLVVAYNLAQAVQTIHQSGDYVIVDLKPENIFVREDASIAIIDLDSIQINGMEARFPAKVFTEEYAPPEKHQGLINLEEGSINEDWDSFSLAVIIYELFFGIHPYQASHQNYTTRPELMKEGYFVHGKKKEELHKIPPIHSNFSKVDSQLQKQFMSTFDKGDKEAKLRLMAKGKILRGKEISENNQPQQNPHLPNVYTKKQKASYVKIFIIFSLFGSLIIGSFGMYFLVLFWLIIIPPFLGFFDALYRNKGKNP